MISIVKYLTVEESVEVSEVDSIKQALKDKGLLSEVSINNAPAVGPKALINVDKEKKKEMTAEGGTYEDLGKEIGKNIKNRNAMLAAAGEGGDYSDLGREIGKNIRNRNQALKDAMGESGCGSKKSWMKK